MTGLEPVEANIRACAGRNWGRITHTRKILGLHTYTRTTGYLLVSGGLQLVRLGMYIQNQSPECWKYPRPRQTAHALMVLCMYVLHTPYPRLHISSVILFFPITSDHLSVSFKIWGLFADERCRGRSVLGFLFATEVGRRVPNPSEQDGQRGGVWVGAPGGRREAGRRGGCRPGRHGLRLRNDCSASPRLPPPTAPAKEVQGAISTSLPLSLLRDVLWCALQARAEGRESDSERHGQWKSVHMPRSSAVSRDK